MDIRAAQAREHHQLAGLADKQGAQHREQRDRLVRSLREDGWTYEAIAKAVGCSPELIAKILTRPRRQSAPGS